MSPRSIHEEMPKTRAAAKLAGAPRYLTGKPCRNGHVSERYISGACCKCISASQKRKYYANRESHLAKSKAYFKKNPDSNHKSYLKRTYGISYENYRDMLARQGE